jgi:predicted P-loop ATPase
VRSYLDGLRGKWDGVDRNLVEYLGAELTQYHLAVCEKWMISAVARAMVPGAKADAMLILEGRQGHRKSTAIRCLCPDVRWFFEVASRAVGNKDFMQDMRGKWLCEVPEVDQLTLSRDESELKALLTRQSDNYRPSYARKSRDFLRQLVFAATTNKTEYLRDETGNRRYWPVACGVVGAIREAALCTDRDQLWAQAVALYDKGMASRAAGDDTCVWWLDPEETELAVEEQRSRLEEDPWTQAVTDWLEGHPDAVREGFRSTDVLAGLPGAKPAADLEQRDLTRVGKTLRLLGFESRKMRVGEGDRPRMWFKPSVT